MPNEEKDPVDFTEVAISGYGAYGISAKGVNFEGKLLPQWSELPDSIKANWVAAARAMCKLFYRKMTR